VNDFDLTALVPAPVNGESPDAEVNTDQYTGTIHWKADDTDLPDGGKFEVGVVYKAEVTLTAAEGFTFEGVAADKFKHDGAVARGAVTNPAGNGTGLTVIITFPQAVPAAVSDFDLSGKFVAPRAGERPDSPIDGGQYTSAIEWKKDGAEFEGNFAQGGKYQAVITLKAKPGYTFNGVTADKFAYDGATVTNPAGAGETLTVTVTFPQTGLDSPGDITSHFNEYLAGQSGGTDANSAIPLPAAIQLTEANWNALLGAIGSYGQFVALDLSDCAPSVGSSGGGLRSNGGFDPQPSVSTGKDKIAGLTLPRTATDIVDGTAEAPAFQGFTALQTVDCGQVMGIGAYAFSGCSALEQVEFSKAAAIGQQAFAGCPLLRFTLTGEAGSLSTEAENDTDGKMLIRDNTVLVSYPSASGPVEIPADILTISAYAFWSTGLTGVSAPKVISIGEQAFADCVNLASVDLSKAASIGAQAFQNTGLTSLDDASLPKVVTIGNQAFANCVGLTSVTLPEVPGVGNQAFAGCDNLESVDLPLVTNIGAEAFQGTGLTSVDFPQAAAIGAQAFAGCDNLASVTLPLVTNIGAGAFQGTGLTRVDFPQAAAIGNQAFADCANLESITAPEARTIGVGAFQNTRLTSVEFPQATAIGAQAFADCANLASITAPEARTIGAGAFQGTGLTRVDFPQATAIGAQAFADCASLTTLIIPNVSSIGEKAFQSCDALESVTLGGSPPGDMGEELFAGISTPSP
jgi:hypothetical protein